MAAIRPKNTDTIQVNKIQEKTAASGITLDHDAKVTSVSEKTLGVGVPFNHKIKADFIEEKTVSSGVLINTFAWFTNIAGVCAFRSIIANCQLGTSAQPFSTLFCSLIQAASNMLFGPTNASKLEFQTNSIVRERILSDGTRELRLGHTGYTSGGELSEVTRVASTNSATPVNLFTYTINGNTSLALRVEILTRDSVAITQSFISAVVTGSRAGAGAIAGAVTVLHTVGAALVTITTAAVGNNIQVNIQNVAGTNTLFTVGCIRVFPVSTST